MPDSIDLTERDRSILRSVLARYTDRIDRVAIFGSRAMGCANPSSDIDLVVYGSLDDADVASIWSAFAESMLPVSVDVVRYDALEADSLRRHIDRCARLLFRRDDLQTVHLSASDG